MVAYTLRNICEKNYQFLSSIKKTHKRKLVICFLPHGVCLHPVLQPIFRTTWVSQYQKGKTSLDVMQGIMGFL